MGAEAGSYWNEKPKSQFLEEWEDAIQLSGL